MADDSKKTDGAAIGKVEPALSIGEVTAKLAPFLARHNGVEVTRYEFKDAFVNQIASLGEITP